MRLDIANDECGHGGMRELRKATIVENCNHSLLLRFSKGTEVLIKECNNAVLNAAEVSNFRSLIKQACVYQIYYTCLNT